MYLWGRRRDVPRIQGQHQRNKVCTDKVDAVLSLPAPKCLKDVQNLNGKLASLNRTSHTYNTIRNGRAHCLPGSSKRSRLILTNPKVAEFTYAPRFRFEATNNEAEYEALIAGLRITEEMGVGNLHAYVDSRLVANQVNGTSTKEAYMIRYLKKVRALANSFRMFSIKQVPRRENKKADTLSKIASTSFTHLSKQVLVEKLKEKSINEANKARAVRRKSQRFAVINGVMYKKLFLGPWLRNGDTSFSLTYGTEAVIPAEIGMPTLRKIKVDMVQNDEALEINLDLLEERRERAAIREAKSKAKIENITTKRSVAQALIQETSCTVAMMQAMRKK
uniref:Reverse transcriptase domain-containing protein n=1 Tax=Tanacetum cinerariifolium TaxID=118510 RepID=A0A6L2LED8_TANCI|nr:reverse transcriptase domain-containing protein [Tanacetum cinerariifolium]